MGLLGVERRLPLGLDQSQGLALGFSQHVELRRALDKLGVLVRAGRGAARGQPVVEGLAGGQVVGLRDLKFELRLRQHLARLRARSLSVFDGLAQFGAGSRVHEVVQRLALLDFGQVVHHGAAQPDQETGEHQGDQPQAPAEPLFRQSQRFAHDLFLVAVERRRRCLRSKARQANGPATQSPALAKPAAKLGRSETPPPHSTLPG